MTTTLLRERIGITLRRVIAWWIDAFAVAAAVLILKWLISLAAGDIFAGRAGDVYDIVALAVVFYLYRVITEAVTGTSLGKWSLRLEVLPTRAAWPSAALRNAWLLVPLISLAQLPFSVEGIILAVLGLSVLFIGQTPFDLLAGCLVERKPREEVGPGLNA